ncbi:hypothetical protein [Streptococcus agalactiae]|uniref:hypothetical protein n=3 Tax=Streptococcus agalactiae TaxID=1311 RepID=UPI00059B2F02|nr:hypothetical protein B7934_09695 [Streptococcus agalactiae]
MNYKRAFLKGSFIIHYFSMTNISEVNFYLTIVIINAVLPLINQRKSFFYGNFFILYFLIGTFIFDLETL